MPYIHQVFANGTHMFPESQHSSAALHYKIQPGVYSIPLYRETYSGDDRKAQEEKNQELATASAKVWNSTSACTTLSLSPPSSTTDCEEARDGIAADCTFADLCDREDHTSDDTSGAPNLFVLGTAIVASLVAAVVLICCLKIPRLRTRVCRGCCPQPRRVPCPPDI